MIIQGGRLFNEMVNEMIKIDIALTTLNYNCHKYNLTHSEKTQLKRLINAGNVDLATTILEGLIQVKRTREIKYKEKYARLKEKKGLKTNFKAKKPWRSTNFQ